MRKILAFLPIVLIYLGWCCIYWAGHVQKYDQHRADHFGYVGVALMLIGLISGIPGLRRFLRE